MPSKKNLQHIPIEQLKNQLSVDFEIPESALTAPLNDYEQVRSELANHIDHLLKTNRALLWASLYRIDVSEKDVRKAMSDKHSAMVLAELILQKLNEKLYWRNLYKDKSR